MNINRYIRQEHLQGFGTAAQQKLAAASVLVVGAGGLGVPALQYLCGMGIGKIGIVDGDTVSITNLHRQVLYDEADINKSKAFTAAAKLKQLNSHICIDIYDTMLTAANAIDIISKYDVVIDATDNFTARYIVNDACIITGKPFVYGAIQSWEAQLSVFNYKGGPTYRCVYPTTPGTNEIPDCNTAGVLGVVPGIVGCRQALEAVKIITGVGKPLSGRLKIFDFENDAEYSVKLTSNPVNRQITSLAGNEMQECAAVYKNLSPYELNEWFLQGKEFLLLDVREEQEYNNGHIEQAVNVPLSILPGEVFATGRPLVTMCKSGARSQRAATLLREKNNELDLYNLTGGFDNWIAVTK
ncbi:MAG TPA: HesA/MoeB/ThiF family protein [Chitinophagaceae bacterium]|nr:HesA/MoeB/ThiF family protein [Chitinophagaceae bacterium]